MQRVWCFSIASYSSGYYPVQGLFFVRILMSLFRMTDWSQVCNRTFFSFLRQLSGNAIVQHKSRYARDSVTSAPSCFVWRDTTISILHGLSFLSPVYYQGIMCCEEWWSSFIFKQASSRYVAAYFSGGTWSHLSEAWVFARLRLRSRFVDGKFEAASNILFMESTSVFLSDWRLWLSHFLCWKDCGDFLLN